MRYIHIYPNPGGDHEKMSPGEFVVHEIPKAEDAQRSGPVVVILGRDSEIQLFIDIDLYFSVRKESQLAEQILISFAQLALLNKS